MDSVNRKGPLLPTDEALMLAHEAELVALAQKYVEQVEAVQAVRDRAIASIRSRASRALVELVAKFETERSATLARFAVRCEKARATAHAPGVKLTQMPKRRTGAN